MTEPPFGLHQATPAELRDRLTAERGTHPFLLYRDDQGAQRIVELDEGRSRLSFGRSPDADVALTWDSQVSRLHAELERVGRHWVIADDGLSRNGTFVAGERVSGRRRLQDGDVLRLGITPILFRSPATTASAATRLSDQPELAASVTDAQRRVLVALCRPFKGSPPYATPATNPQIAEELFLSVAAVKTHLRALFHTFGIDDLPQQEKRLRLVAAAFSSGLVRDNDL
jgi:pSer/pThr/pTyr-binding forkhead associated (FHA) protein